MMALRSIQHNNPTNIDKDKNTQSKYKRIYFHSSILAKFYDIISSFRLIFNFLIFFIIKI